MGRPEVRPHAGGSAGDTVSDDLGFSSNVIAFPARLRVVATETLGPSQPDPRRNEPQTAVEHDGRVYDLAELLRHLSPAELRQVGETAPRSCQALWDEVVRRWPALAAEIMAGVGVAG